MKARSQVGLAAIGVFAGLLTARPTGAQNLLRDARDTWSSRQLILEAGTGFANFTEGGTKTLTDPGAMWTVRGILGARRVLSAELGYIGSARPAEIPGVVDASVVQTGFEALARVGYPALISDLVALTPYAGLGVGWSLYNLAGEERPVPGLSDNDGVFTLPLAFGVMAGYDRLSLDFRFVYRPAWGESLFNDLYDGQLGDGLNSLGLSAALGLAF